MAHLAVSAVSIQRRWTEGDRFGKNVQKCVDAILTLTGQGGTTNTIPATVFGLSAIHEVSRVSADGNTLLLGSPSYDGSLLLLFTVVTETDADRDDPADITDTVRVIVKGKASA